MFLDSFEKLPKVTTSRQLRYVSVRPSVRPSVRTEQLVSRGTNFREIRYLRFFRKSIKKIHTLLTLYPMPYRTANLQTLHFKYLFNKYPY
jgi:hypothetical protein